MVHINSWGVQRMSRQGMALRAWPCLVSAVFSEWAVSCECALIALSRVRAAVRWLVGDACFVGCGGDKLFFTCAVSFYVCQCAHVVILVVFLLAPLVPVGNTAVLRCEGAWVAAQSANGQWCQAACLLAVHQDCRSLGKGTRLAPWNAL